MDSINHAPLDHAKQSIRLLRLQIEDDNPDMIQCVIRNTTINARYSCLSYRWGDDTPRNRILVNGKEVLVRKNLFNFLKIAAKFEWQQKVQRICDKQEHYSSQEWWFWIDALCIDQNNYAERNHQVQQMGKIFAGAVQVFMWLGETENRCLLTESTSLLQKDTYLVKDLLENEYWRRAWVTQEIVLARHAILLANEEAVELKAFASNVMDILSSRGIMTEITRERFWTEHSPFIQFTTDFSTIRGTSLVQLLARFKHRKCSLARDRIFSLLSICGHDTGVKADYRLPGEEIIFQTLESSKEQLCLCSAATVARALELEDEIRLRKNLLGCGPSLRPYIEMDVYAQLILPNSWCVLYSNEHEYPRTYLGEGPGTVFNVWKTCPMGKNVRLYWRQPSSPRERQFVRSEPFAACDSHLITRVCQYGEGFSVTRKSGTQCNSRMSAQGVCSAQSRLSTGADNLNTVRWNFDHSQNLDLHGGIMRSYGMEQEHQVYPDDYIDTLDVYTIRMSFVVLAKIMIGNVTWYNAHCEFKREICNKGSFEYARIGYEHGANP